MVERSASLAPQLVGWLESDFDLRVVDAVPVEGGVDREARLWRVRDAGGRDFAVKWTSGGTAGGLAVARALADAGVEGIAAPLRTRTGGSWSDRGGRRLMVLPWVDAPVALDAVMREGHWVAFGRLLAVVHATPVAALPDLPSSDQQHRRLRGAVAVLHRHLDGALDPQSVTVEHDDLVAFVLDEALLLRGLVDTLLAGADQLHASGNWSGQDAPRVACHADPHLGNVLVDDEADVWLLDWDDAVTAPREQDLLFMLDGGVLAFAPVAPEQREAFFTGYGPVTISQHALAYHRSLRALEDLVEFTLELLAPDRHTRTAREAAAGYLRGNLAQGGLTEAALRSLQEVGALTSAAGLLSR